MGRVSDLSQAQQADLAARRREGRPDIAAMSSDERSAAGLMTVGQAAEHERLRSLPHARLAERVKGRVPDDLWAAPEPDAFEAWQRSVWDAWEKAGHYERACSGWVDDVNGNVMCATCLEAVPVPVPEGGEAA